MHSVRKVLHSAYMWASLVVLAGAMAVASSASAANARGVVNLYSGPAPFGLLGGTWPNGYLTMHCWYDNYWSFGTNRWFLVTGVTWNPMTGRINWTTGWANANQVANQQVVPRYPNCV